MNYSFSLSHDGKVNETKWFGKLTGEIIAMGFDDRNTWIEKNAKKTPLVQLSDYIEADVEKVTADGLLMVASRFRGFEDNYPEVHWISIVPTDLKFGLASLLSLAGQKWKVPNNWLNDGLAKSASALSASRLARGCAVRIEYRKKQ